MSRDALSQTARQLRSVLADVDAGQLTCSAATRRRLEGAMLAMDVLALGEQADGQDQVGLHPEVRA